MMQLYGTSLVFKIVSIHTEPKTHPTMKAITTTFLLLMSTMLLFGKANHAPITICVACSNDSSELISEFRQVLLAELRADDLISNDAKHVKIEFEYHDIFVNETIIEFELTPKYKSLFERYGIEPGPQRQIRVLSSGEVVIGDFGLQNELLESVQLGFAG